MNVTINIVQLASELADLELNNLDLPYLLYNDSGGEITYTEPAQEEFNELYDKYYSIIESNIETPKLKLN